VDDSRASTPAAEARAPIGLPLAALVAGAAPIVAAGVFGSSGSSDLELALPLESAFDLALVLEALVLTVVWPLVALSRGARLDGLRGRALELALLAAGAAPGLRIASLLSGASEPRASRALVALAAIACGQAVWLAALARARVRRSTGVLIGVAAALGAPLAVAFAREAGLSGAWLLGASAPVAVLGELHGEGAAFFLAGAFAALGGAVALGSRVRLGSAAFAAVAGVLVLSQVARAQERTAKLELVAARPLLGPQARPGELAPLRLELRAGPTGFEGEVGARGSGLTVLVPVRLAPLASGEFALPAVADPSGSPLALEARPRGEPAFPLEGPALAPILAWAPLPGELDGTPGDLARALPLHRTSRVVVARSELDLLALAGSALDALAAPAAALRDAQCRPRLAAFVASGGALATDDASALEALDATSGAGPLASTDGVVRRGLGAGIVIAPAERGGVAAVGSELALRLSARTRPHPDSLADALDRAPEPRPSPRVAGRIALLAALVASALAVVLVAARRSSPASLAGTFALASLVTLLAFPAIGLDSKARPLVLETSEVLEAPSGGTIAGSTTVLRFASARSGPTRIDLLPAAPIAAIFESEAEAARSGAELRLENGAPSLEPTASELAFPLGTGPALFFRRTVRDLGGKVELERRGGELSIANGLSVPLESPLVVSKDGVFALPDLAPRVHYSIALGEPEPAKTFFARAVANARPRERARWELLRAAFSPRLGAGALRLTAFLPLDPPRQTSSGVLDEVSGPVVLVVRD
jgi:hypothetical protein